jgi:hypothetical protein
MNKIALAVAGIISALGGPVNAALPPQFQNANDLDVMVAFIKKHPRVASTLKSIDLHHYIIRFDTDCKAEFKRQKIARPPGWVGPAAPLVLSRSNCKLNRET